jgi:penicillin-binding protein 1C
MNSIARPFFLLTVTSLILLSALLSARWFWVSALTVPSYAQVRAAHKPSDALLLDRHGRVLHELRIDPRHRRLPWAALNEISSSVPSVIVAAEDRRFFRHGGVDFRALINAGFTNLSTGTRRGGSTISMQLAGMLEPKLRPVQGRRGLRQKLAQMRWAWGLERTWTKPEILEAYLNLASFRGELEGIAAASRGLFEKLPTGLSQNEALVLAALLRSPNAAPEAIAKRACRLGKRLALVQDCASVREPVATAQRTLNRLRPAEALAPHAARRLLSLAQAQLRSSLDLDLQRLASEALREQIAQLQARGVKDGAVLAVDNLSGEVLAYVGNGGAASSAEFVDGVQAQRQAGSSLKPFLYQLALEQRVLTAASWLKDDPLQIATPGGLYIPQNYDKHFKGLVTVRASLAGSLNVPAVQTLMLVGLDPFIERLRRLGLTQITKPAEYYGYALALGSTEISLWELVNAYRTLANGGQHSGLVLLPRREAPAGSRAMDEGAAFIVADILADRGARSATFGLDSPLATPFWSAVKTGTSKDMRDNWCVGFTPRFTVGVWIGNFGGEPMHNVSGVTGAGPLWLRLMRYLHAREPAPAPTPPASVLAQSVAFEPAAEAARGEWFLRGTETARVRLGSPAAGKPEIVYPTEGMLIALDPDIPPDRQRVAFAATAAAASLHWQLDGRPLPPSAGGWQPLPGRHRLSLVDERGAVHSSVHFEVRGNP